jgi:hypothetical protein
MVVVLVGALAETSPNLSVLEEVVVVVGPSLSVLVEVVEPSPSLSA